MYIYIYIYLYLYIYIYIYIYVTPRQITQAPPQSSSAPKPQLRSALNCRGASLYNSSPARGTHTSGFQLSATLPAGNVGGTPTTGHAFSGALELGQFEHSRLFPSGVASFLGELVDRVSCAALRNPALRHCWRHAYHRL